MACGWSQGATLGELGEAAILEQVFARVARTSPHGMDGPVLVGPGDDTALLRTRGAVLVTTDTMVLGRDWRDEWSTPQDVGGKVVAQNLADLAAMGGVGTGLVVTLVAPRSTRADWVLGFVDGLAAAAQSAEVPVVGGDLSSSAEGVMVSVTAIGELPGPGPVLRSGAGTGQLLAVRGSLGWSAAGLELLRRGETGWWPPTDMAGSAANLVAYHCRPTPDLAAGPAAAAAGATAMIDVSDGLVRDAARIASASGVRIDLDTAAVLRHAEVIEPVLGRDAALDCVLTGGEEHSLLAAYPQGAVPAGWGVIGLLSAPGDEAPGVWWRGERFRGGGWDHFGPADA